MVSLNMALPYEGHLKEDFHLVAYLNTHMKLGFLFGPTVPCYRFVIIINLIVYASKEFHYNSRYEIGDNFEDDNQRIKVHVENIFLCTSKLLRFSTINIIFPLLINFLYIFLN